MFHTGNADGSGLEESDTDSMLNKTKQILKREKELFYFFNKTIKQGFFIFFKYNFLNFLWRFFGKNSATKYSEAFLTQVNFKEGGRLLVNWLPIFVGIFNDKEYTRYKGFEIIKGQTIVDLGANRGYYTYFAAKRTGTEGKVISVEPYQPNFEILLKQVKNNNLNQVICRKCAITGKNGSTDFFVSSESGSHSLVNKTEKKISVKTETLETLLKGIKKVDILKMDVEGAEVEILSASKKALKKVTRIVLETHENAEEIKDLLKNNGFNLIEKKDQRIIYSYK
jgi:FkbM family methyltransferase